MPSSTLHNAEFLSRRTPCGGSSTDCTTVGSTAEKHFGSVDVGVVPVPAGHASESLPVPARRVNVSTDAARLRAVGWLHFDDGSTRPDALVGEHRAELAPRGVEDASIQAGLLPDVGTGLIDSPACAARHIPHLQLFDHDDAVVLGVACRLNMEDVVPLPADLAVYARDAVFGLFPVLRSSFPSVDSTLGALKAQQGVLERLRIRQDTAVRVGDEVGDATIDGDGWSSRRHGIRHLDLARDRSEPLVTVTADGTSLGFALKWAVRDDLDVTELGEVQTGRANMPGLGVRLNKRDPIAPLTLPARSVCKPLEAALPRLIEFDEELSTDIPRHIGKPRQLSTKFSQLLHLIESCRIAFGRTRKTHQSLLVSKVPEETQCILPGQDPLYLLIARIDAKAESLIDEHEATLASTFAQGSRNVG